jgi:hypothetical protein
MRMSQDTDAQMSIDFVIGVGIFLMAFIFVLIAIPGLFTPFQSNSDELTMTADRVATTLTENVLPETAPTGELLPGIVDISKYDDLKGVLSGSGSLAKRDSLGLKTGDRTYNLEVDILYENGTKLSAPDNLQTGGQNIGQSRRFVYVRDPNSANSIDVYPGQKALLVVRVW